MVTATLTMVTAPIEEHSPPNNGLGVILGSYWGGLGDFGVTLASYWNGDVDDYDDDH